MSQLALTEPPEAVLSGDSVPTENQEEEFERIEIEQMISLLKTRGLPYTEMEEYELEDRAISKLEEYK